MNNQAIQQQLGGGNPNRTSLIVKETENGFIASATIQDSTPYKRTLASGEYMIDRRYLDGISGDFVYKTLEDAFKNAPMILKKAYDNLQIEIKQFEDLNKASDSKKKE